jgi:aspartokinase
MVVLKFGGTSVGEADARRRVLEIVEAEPRPRVVVVSALSGVTDALLKTAAAVLSGALAEATDVRIRTDLAMVVVVGEDVTSQSRLFAEAAAVLREMRVYLTGRPAGGRSLAFVVDAANVDGALGRLHDCFFGVASTHHSVSRDVVQA